MNILGIILMGAPAEGQEGGGYQSFIFLILILVVSYFFMIRPQMKRQKEMRKFRESLGKGDKVVTAGGIHGKIKAMDETTIDVEISDNVVITVEKSTVNPIGAPQQKQ
ncbi:MAG: preprotein translocase subunit YajC [Bacteroidota bacterium]|nr:preprotein translocase subunit YajC [Bacteroidota bacterium]